MKNKKKQQLLLEYLISSPDTFALCKSIVKSDYFDPEFRKTMDFVHGYYDKYNALPNTDQISAETNIDLKVHQVTKDQISYCSTEVEQFCRREALKNAIWSAPDLINKGDEGKVEQMVRDALGVSLNREIGLQYYKDPTNRLEERKKIPLRTPTKIKEIDRLLNGGLARTEMILFSANSGGGKSITLANLALNFVEQGLSVLYVSLELSELMIADRFDIMHSGIPINAMVAQQAELLHSISSAASINGKLTIKKMPVGTNSNAIRAYLKEFELKFGYVPDMMIVDYLDIMAPNEQVSADNISEKDKRSSEQLRDIGFDFNMFMATASQQTRGALEAEKLNQGHIAGGITKVNTVDVYISILFSDAMKAAGQIGFVFLKSRSSDAVGKTVYANWDNNYLRIKNLRAEGETDAIIAAVSKQKLGDQKMSEKKTLLSLLS